MKPEAFVTAATVLFGFLFAGFWWALDREITFKPEDRHFKPGYVLLLVSMTILATLGIIVPLGRIAANDPDLLWTYRGVVLVLLGVIGYMLTEFGHYGVFQWPKYATWQEHLFFWLTTAALLGLPLYWLLRRA